MESDYTVAVSSVDENLDVAISTFWSIFLILPFKRLEFLMISKNILRSEFSFSGFFIITTGSILKWSKDSGWNINIVHFLSGSSEESLRKKITSFDSNWSKFKLSIDNITNSINVRNIGLLFVINLEFTILFAGYTSCSKVDSTCHGVSSDSK